MFKKGQRVYYDTGDYTHFGFYAGKMKVHATFKKGETHLAPYGTKKGKTYHAIENPNIGFWEMGHPNVFFPSSRYLRTTPKKR